MRYKLYCQSCVDDNTGINDNKKLLEVYEELQDFNVYEDEGILYIKLKSLIELDRLTNRIEYPLIVGNYTEDGTGKYIEICDTSSVDIAKR